MGRVFFYTKKKEPGWMDFTVCVRILGWAWRLSGWAALSLIRCGSLSVVSTVHVRDEMALHPKKEKKR